MDQKPLSLFLLLALAIPLWGKSLPAAESRPIVLKGDAFGTTYSIKVETTADEAIIAELENRISEVIDSLNSQMSLWEETSEISRFNRGSGGQWLEVSPQFRTVVERSLEIREATRGALDPTVRPLLALWSFGPDQRPRVVPDEAEIQQAMSHVGVPIELRETPTSALSKPADEVELDLNAIAKGYAVDVITELVGELDATGAMIEIGGEVRTIGTKADGQPWRIAIERPEISSRKVGWVIDLEDGALATSGDYRNFFEFDGRRYSHTIDPRTGRPIRHRLASVSVVADDCMTADGWATALMVLGPDEGYNLAEERGIAAFFLVREGESFVSRATSGFPAVRQAQPPMSDISSWSTFVIAAAIFGVAVAGMAVGVILSNRRLRGSCGGVNGTTDSEGRSICDLCTTPAEECDEVRRQIAAASDPRETSAT